MLTPGQVADDALLVLRAMARPPSDHPASGGWGTRMERLGLTTDECLSTAKEVQRHCGGLSGREVVAVAVATTTVKPGTTITSVLLMLSE